MTNWTSSELDAIGTADELEIAPLRHDGTPRPAVPVWVVRDGDGLYVRSFRGTDGSWYRSARAQGSGHIHAGGIGKDVALVPEDDSAVNHRVDEAYRRKYGRYGDRYVGPLVGAQAHRTTLKLVPR
ncbi:DUF2255 family protein [Streptomyces sp. NPDC007157]|uniref:DUF2255 family protein n=1 Tax=Streptomyces sp. NPDC007157 TaxID=3154681 RepID=UPI0033E49555